MSNGRSPRPKWADGFPANGLVFFKLYPAGFKKKKKNSKNLSSRAIMKLND
jgi:hypothetical protein